MKLDNLPIPDMDQPAQVLEITTLILRSQTKARATFEDQLSPGTRGQVHMLSIQSRNNVPATPAYLTTSINLAKLSTTSYLTFSGA
jgi:hypothetical protein